MEGEWVPLDPNQISDRAREHLEFFLKNIKGQDNAVKDLVDAIEIYTAGLNLKNKPIYVVLLLGPSGVGKTLMAELLAEWWFGSRSAFTKIDCANFNQSHSTEELIGSPPGYVGFGQESKLSQNNIDKPYFQSLKEYRDLEKEIQETLHKLFKLQEELSFNRNISRGEKESLRREFTELEKKLDSLNFRKNLLYSKFGALSIILFDEIEKANSALYNLILGITDKAELRLRNGAITKFNYSVIFMTSNIGSKAIADLISDKKIGFSTGAEKAGLDYKIYENAAKAARSHFSPEFLGRIDKLIVFRPLSKEVMQDIIVLEIENFQKEITPYLKIIISVTEEVKDFILQECLDKPQEGARLIKKKVIKFLRSPISRMKNCGKLKEGDILLVSLEKIAGKSKLVFARKQNPILPS